MRLLLVAVLALVGGACAGSPTSPDQVRDYFSPPKSSPGLTWTNGDRQVDTTELNTVAGPEHCHWDSAVLLYIGWPLGTVASSITQARLYVRDPEGVFPRELRKGLRQDAALPADARDTGYRSDDLQLWLAPSDPDAVYLRVDRDVERWPRANAGIVCA
ncbi:hypothetical protein [Actinopolymorpha pittospori]|uniref:Lipoprotein n=1 Tax=Actinopolymorpha pittospori TaxID=648752 RepID=A0A927MSE7_9ACTN|nr:hypothetical protein [Actinopolymorpha pittospori]MBE1605294.1 hypothetical protein [Actinopolymorpha pittospori]